VTRPTRPLARTAVPTLIAVLVLIAGALSALTAPTGTTATAATAATAEQTARRGPHVKWGPTAVNPGTKIRARGKVPGGKRKVTLQVKVKRSWQTFGSTRSNRKGKFRVAGRLDWYGKHKVRVLAPGRRPFARSKKVGVYPPYVPIGNPKDHDLIHGTTVAANYRFNPCQTIRYRLNTADVGPAAKPLIKLALTQVTWATGMRFKYVGKTKLIPYNMGKRQRYPRGTHLVIAFATHAEVPDFDRRTAAGFGGPRWLFPARNSSGRRVWMTSEAGVTLSTDYWNNGFAHSFFDNTRATIGELMLHEVGHAVGLDHVPNAPQEIMNGRGYYRYPDGYYKGLFNLGDLTGLAKVGLKQGCLRPIRHARVSEVPVEGLPLP
jgi:hypothetical protein